MTEKQENFGIMGGAVTIHANKLYHPTSDAVWLAAFAPINAKTVLDVGTGTGAVALCYGVHNRAAQITGIDVSDEMLSECKTNIALNNATDNFQVYNHDILTWRTPQTFDLVITNPPYFQGTPAKHNAHHNADLAQWLKKCVARVRPNGTICTILDATTLATAVSALNEHCGDIYIMPLFGRKNTAERILIRARQGAHGGTTLHQGLSMNTDAILRDGLTIECLLARLGTL